MPLEAIQSANWAAPRNRLRYVVIDRFLRADAAPLEAIRRSAPGPGGTIATQTDGNLAIVNRKLVLAPQSSPAWGDQRLLLADSQGSSLSFPRADQRPFVFDLASQTAGQFRAGYWPNTSLGATLAAGFDVQVGSGGAVRLVFLPTTGTTDIGGARFAVLPQSGGGAGYAVFLPPGAMGTEADGRWHFLALTTSGTDATLYGGLSNYDSDAELASIAVPRLSTTLTPRLNAASPVSGTEYAGVGVNVLGDVKFTVGGSLVAGHRQEVRFRWIDDQNYLGLRLTVNGGATAANLTLVEVVDGAETTLDGPSGSWTAGQSVWVQTLLIEDAARTVNYRSTASGTTWTRVAAGGGNLAQTERGRGVKPVVTGSGTVTELKVWGTALPNLG